MEYIIENNNNTEQSLSLGKDQLQVVAGGVDYVNHHVATCLKAANEYLGMAQKAASKGLRGDERVFEKMADYQLQSANRVTASASEKKAKWSNLMNAWDEKWHGSK